MYLRFKKQTDNLWLLSKCLINCGQELKVLLIKQKNLLCENSFWVKIGLWKKILWPPKLYVWRRNILTPFSVTETKNLYRSMKNYFVLSNQFEMWMILIEIHTRNTVLSLFLLASFRFWNHSHHFWVTTLSSIKEGQIGNYYHKH